MIKHVEPHVKVFLVVRHDVAGGLAVHIMRSRFTDDQLTIEVFEMLELRLHELIWNRLVAATVHHTITHDGPNAVEFRTGEKRELQLGEVSLAGEHGLKDSGHSASRLAPNANT